MIIDLELVRKASEGCRDSAEIIIGEMRPIIVRMVHKFFGCLDEDAMQEAALSVLRAINTYRFDLNTAFTSHCHNIMFFDLVANNNSVFRRELEYRSRNCSMSGFDAAYSHDYDTAVFCRDMLEKLDERSADFVRRRFGLSVDEESIANIAANTGLTKRRVQQIIKEALEKLTDRFGEKS